jgi:DNA-binding SARP family transcriptional activator/TolB-like protein
VIELRVLGSVDLRGGSGAALDDLLRQPKRVALLLYLALAEPPGLQRRDTLLALFWPDLDAARARAALRKSLYVLRGALGLDVITTCGDDEVGVDRGQLHCDALAFTAALAEGRVADSLALYRGDLLPGFHVSEVSSELEQWLDARRAELRRRAFVAGWKHAADLAQAGQGLEAVRWGRWASARAPDNEAGVRRLLELLGRLGDRAGVMQFYEEFRKRLRAEYDVEPAPETQELVAAIGSEPARPLRDLPATVAPAEAAVTPPLEAPQIRRPWKAALLVVPVLGVAVLIALTRGAPSVSVQPDRVAVAPFTVLSPAASLEVWKEGMVDLLARNLDGAGPLRSVPPAEAIRLWKGAGRAESAMRLGRNSGAGLVVFGSLLGLAGDSTRVSATVLDVTTGRLVGDVDIRGSLEHMDMVVDSLTRELLRKVQRVRQIASARFTGIGSSSVPALKAFLQGEQFRRRTAWDSVVIYDQEATRLDSTFALAWLRLGEAYSVTQFPVPLASGPTPDNPWYLIHRAGRLNHGLTRHDSLAVDVAAGVAAYVLGDTPSDLGIVTSAQRRSQASHVYQAALDGTRFYPDDAEAWFGVALVQDFLGDVLETTNAQTYASYSRVIALDSGFAPAYRMALRISGDAGDVPGTRRLAEHYLKLDPSPSRDIPLLIAGLLDPAVDSAAAQRLVEFDAERGALAHADRDLAAARLGGGGAPRGPGDGATGSRPALLVHLELDHAAQPRSGAGVPRPRAGSPRRGDGRAVDVVPQLRSGAGDAGRPTQSTGRFGLRAMVGVAGRHVGAALCPLVVGGARRYGGAAAPADLRAVLLVRRRGGARHRPGRHGGGAAPVRRLAPGRWLRLLRSPCDGALAGGPRAGRGSARDPERPRAQRLADPVPRGLDARASPALLARG